MKRRYLLAIVAIPAFVIACSSASQDKKAELQITDQVLADLQKLRQEPKFLDLPGAPAERERQRLEPLINDLVSRLIQGIRASPTKTWVLSQMEPTVATFYLEDTEARERCIDYLERVFKIVGIRGADGAFQKYMIAI